jgi:serine/threonine-protein kinase
MTEGRFGKYFLLRKIASGGMGEVFLARQQGPEGFEKILVIKRILSHHSDNRDYVDMFFAEARLAAKMSHSNIVQIYEMGEIDDAYYIAMEFVNGKSIKDIIDAARASGSAIPAAHTADIVAKLCAGLGYAHALTDMAGANLNIIHRDVNPHNVLVTYGGEAKIIDFGIAKSDMNEHKTETGTIKGKFVYMSPEQSAAEKIDKRSDIFSIGIVLYEMLSGENPFQKANIVLSLDAIQRFDPPPPSSIDPDFVAFDPIVAKALAKTADARYQDCSEMQHDLQRILAVGEIRRAPTPLGKFMQDLFREQIEKENKFIQETGKGMALPPGSAAGVRTRPASGAFAADARTEPDLTPEPMLSPAQSTESRSAPHTARRGNRRVVASIAAIVVSAAIVSVALILASAPKAAPPSAVQVLNPLPAQALAQVTPPPVQPQVVEQPQAIEPPPQPQLLPPPIAHPTVKPQPVQLTHKRDPHGDSGRRPHEADKPQVTAVVSPQPVRPETPKADPVTITPVATGYFLLNSSPQSSVFLGSHALGTGAPVRIDVKSPNGVIRVGDPGTPFQLTFQYRITGPGSIELAVDSEPWAILKKNGVGIGKTPRPSMTGDTRPMRFEFVNPAVTSGMSVVLRFFPG